MQVVEYRIFYFCGINCSNTVHILPKSIDTFPNNVSLKECSAAHVYRQTFLNIAPLDILTGS